MIFAIAVALLSTIGTTSRIGDLDDYARVVTNVDESAVLTKSFSNDVGTVTFSPAKLGDKAVWAADNDIVITNFVPYTETNVVTYVDAVTNVVEKSIIVTNYVESVITNYTYTKEQRGTIEAQAATSVWYGVYGDSRWGVDPIFASLSDWEFISIDPSSMTRLPTLDTATEYCYGYKCTGSCGLYTASFVSPELSNFTSYPSASDLLDIPVSARCWVDSGAQHVRFQLYLYYNGYQQKQIVAILSNTVESAGNPFTVPSSRIDTKFISRLTGYACWSLPRGQKGGTVTAQIPDFALVGTPSSFTIVTNEVVAPGIDYITNVTDLVVTNYIPRISTNTVVTPIITRPLISGSGVVISHTNGSVSAYSPGSESGFTEFSNAVASVTASRKMKQGHNVILADDNGGSLSVDVDPARARSSVSLSKGYELNVPSVDCITVGGTVENGRRVGGRTYAREIQDYLDLKSSSLRDMIVSNANASGSVEVDLAVMSDKDGNSVVFRDAKYRRSGSELRYTDGGILDVTRSLTMAEAEYDVWVNLDEEGVWRKIGSISWDGTMTVSPKGDRLRSCTFTHLDTDSMDENTIYPFFKPGTTNRYTVAEIEDTFPAISHPYFCLGFNDEDTVSSFVGGDGRRIWVDHFTWHCSGLNVTNGNPCVIETPRLTGVEPELSFRCEPQKVSIKYVMVGHPTSVTSEYDGQVMSTESVNSGRTPVYSIFGETDPINRVTGDGSVVKRSDPFAITIDFDIRYYGTFSGLSKSVVLYPNLVLMDQGTRDVNAIWAGHRQYSAYPIVVVKYEGPIVGTGKWSSFRYLNLDYDMSNLSVSSGTLLSPPAVFTNANFVTGGASKVYIGDCHTEVIPGSSYAKTSSAVFTTNVVSSITTDRFSVRADGSNFIRMMDSVMATPSLKGSFSNAVHSVSPVIVKDGTNTPWTVSYSNDVFYLVR